MQSFVGPLRVVRGQHVNVHIIELMVKLVVLLVTGRTVDPHRDYLASGVHHLNELWSYVGYLQMASVSMALRRRYHIIGLKQWDIIVKTVKVYGRYLPIIFGILLFEYCQSLMVETLDHAVVGQVKLRNLGEELAHCFLVAVALLYFLDSRDLKLDVHQYAVWAPLFVGEQFE